MNKARFLFHNSPQVFLSGNIHQAQTDVKVWADRNQWGTVCSGGAHACCIPEGINVLQPSHALAQGLFSLSKMPRAAFEPWETLLSTTTYLS